MQVLRNRIVAGLSFFKRIHLYVSIILIALILIYEASNIESYSGYLIRTITVLIVSLLYFDFLYYLINRSFFLKIINPIPFIKFYCHQGKSYLKKQVKEVFVEEFLFKYLPFLVLGNLISGYLWLVITSTAVIFTYIHKFNSLFSLLEFFFFFAICHFFFLEFHLFAFLFLPHLLRNLIIEYLTQHK